MEIIMDMILIMEATITGVMILSIITAGTLLLCSVLTSGTDGVTTIMDGMAIPETMVTIQIMTTMVTIQTDILPVVTPQGETPVTIPKHQPVIIMYPEGEASRTTFREMKLIIAER
jgi:hypothetical protein